MLDAMNRSYYNLFNGKYYSFNDALVLEGIYGTSIVSSYNEIFGKSFEFDLPAIYDLELQKATLLKFKSDDEEISQIQLLTADTVDQYMTDKISEGKFTEDEFSQEIARQEQLQTLFAKYDAMLEEIKTKLKDDIKSWEDKLLVDTAAGTINAQDAVKFNKIKE